MTRTQRFDERINRSFAPFRNPSLEHVEAACQRVLHNLREEGDESPDRVETQSSPAPAAPTWIRAAVAMSAAAAVIAAVVWIPLRERVLDGDALARVEMGDGGLHLVSRGERLQPGDAIDAGDLVRTNGAAGAIVVLSDGSRVEIRAQSEVRLERAEDGARIHLSRGGVIVDAATQRDGHLYVQTRDVTVSVVGTVFVVNANKRGSRIAVLEGEVRVQQGVAEQTLKPGEQLETNPSIVEAIPVTEVVAWSRNAPALLALLPRAPVPPSPSAPSPQPPLEPAEKFEVSSVRASDAFAPAPGARGAGSGDAVNGGPGSRGCVSPNSGHSQQIDPRRLAINRATLFQLVVWAYPVPYFPVPLNPAPHPFYLCGVPSEFIAGGPAWLRTDVWDVEANIPQGLFSSTPALLDPRLRRMLQALLVERFNLVMRRETKELPVYLLKVGRDGPKFNGRRESDGREAVSLGRDGKPLPPELQGRRLDRNGQPLPEPEGTIGMLGKSTLARNLSMDEWARYLFAAPGAVGRPVVDRTGLAGRFDFHFDSAVPLDTSNPEALERSMASYKLEVLEAMGFELEESRALFDVWVIESAERPTEN